MDTFYLLKKCKKGKFVSDVSSAFRSSVHGCVGLTVVF